MQKWQQVLFLSEVKNMQIQIQGPGSGKMISSYSIVFIIDSILTHPSPLQGGEPS
jgi:hypothetical protein